MCKRRLSTNNLVVVVIFGQYDCITVIVELTNIPLNLLTNNDTELATSHVLIVKLELPRHDFFTRIANIFKKLNEDTIRLLFILVLLPINFIRCMGIRTELASICVL